MNPRERNLLICYVSIISGIAVAVFGYNVYSVLFRVNQKFPLIFFLLPLIIIWILVFVTFYYRILIYKEQFVDEQKPVKFWIFYTNGIVVGSLGLLYLTLIDKEWNNFEYAWVFSLLLLIGIIFHSIYWILIYYDKL